MSIRYNSRDEYFKYPFGAAVCNTEVTFRIIAEGNPFDVLLCMGGDKIHMEKEEENVYKTVFKTPDEGQILFYHFEIVYDVTVTYGNNQNCTGGEGAEETGLDYQLTVYEKSDIPSWVSESVCYQIFPDRFYRDGEILSPKENSFLYGSWYDTPMYVRNPDSSIARWDFFGGNLAGIEKKLPYLKELGISMIYLNPIFLARSNHRYDTADYMKIDPVLGDEKAFKSLLNTAKSMGIRIILDGVFNHTGCDSIYFDREDKYGNGAYHNPDSPYRSWYTFSDDGTYESWWGISDLPSVNELEESYVDYIIKGENSVINKWLKMGISGWRLDVADELPDEFLQMLREQCRKTSPDSYVVGEVWEDASNKLSYGKLRTYFTKDELDGVMNYPFRTNMLQFVHDEISAHTLADRFLSLAENYPSENMNASMTILGTHDSERLLSSAMSVEAVKQLSAMQMAYTGLPVVYYGDETGIEGAKDPDNRRTYPWGRENTDLIDWYKKIIKIRNTQEVLKKGKAWFGAVNEDVFFIKRFDRNHTFYAFMNRRGEEVTFPWDEKLSSLLSDQKTEDSITLPPLGAEYFVKV